MDDTPTQEAVASEGQTQQSKMHRFMVGDKVAYQDTSEWPPVDLEGTIAAFGNEELSYVEVKFSDDDTRVLTEDEVKRIA